MYSTYFLFKQWQRAALLATGTLAFLTACDPDNPNTPTPAAQINSVFVVNEGSYGTPDGTISLFDVPSKKVTALDVFQAANSQPLLADVAQSMTIVGNRGYVVGNQNSKLTVVSLPDFKKVTTIENVLSQPRYIVGASADKAYISEWVQPTYPTPVLGRVAVLDLKTNTVTKTIPVGKGPEEMLVANGKLFVANAEESTVTVINTTTDAVETTLTVGTSPSSFALDRDGRVWVLCAGKTNYADATKSVKGSLVDFLNVAPYTARKRDLSFTPGFGSRLRRNGTGDQLYIKSGSGVFRMGIADAAVPTTPFIRRGFYGLDIDPNDNTIYGGLALSYNGPGRMVRYNSSGVALDSATVGISPNGFVFY